MYKIKLKALWVVVLVLGVLLAGGIAKADSGSVLERVLEKVLSENLDKVMEYLAPSSDMEFGAAIASDATHLSQEPKPTAMGATYFSSAIEADGIIYADSSIVNAGAYSGTTLSATTGDFSDLLTLTDDTVSTTLETNLLKFVRTHSDAVGQDGIAGSQLWQIEDEGGSVTNTAKFVVALTDTTTSSLNTKMSWYQNISGTLTEVANLTDGLLNADYGIAVDTNKFTVADATGNTIVGGTLGVSGAATIANTLSVGNNAPDNLYVDDNGTVSINTSTPFAVLGVSNGTVTSSLAVGDVSTGSNLGIYCFWNSSEYTIMSFPGGTTTPTYATSTVCQ